MEIEELFSKSRWPILKELSKGNRSASELAKKTGQSTANATMQLKIMEAYGFVKKAKQPEALNEKRKAGKPKIPFALNQDVGVMGMLRPGLAERRVIKIKEADDFHRMMMATYFEVPPEHHYSVLKYLMDSELIKKAELITVVSISEKEVELFIMTDHLTEIREKFSNRTIDTPDGKTKKIISWSHNRKEVEEGLARKEEYFINLVKKSRELLDKKDSLAGLRQMMAE
ncbi:MAG: winged helix-turn-helix domain-containing protein [archaeon]